MYFIQNSQDILYMVLAFAIFAITCFVCWALYYAILALRDMRIMTHDIRTRVARIWEVVDLLKDKLQVGSAAFKIAATGIKELSEYMKQWTQESPKRKKKPQD